MFTLSMILLFDFFVVSFLVAMERDIAAALLLVATGVATWWFGVPVLDWAATNWQWMIGFGVSYILIGALYTIPKWKLFVSDIRDQVGDYVSKNKIPVFREPVDLWGETAARLWNNEIQRGQRKEDAKEDYAHFVDRVQTWRSRLRVSSVSITTSDDPPHKVKFDVPWRDHKSRFVSWMMFWPFSLFATLINDFVVKLYERLYRILSGVYEKVTVHTFRDLN